MLNQISVELTPAPNYQIPLQPIIAVAEELFPEILSTKSKPLAARDVQVYNNTAEAEYFGGADLLVTVSVARSKALKKAKKQVTQLLTKSLVDVLGDDVDIEVRLYFVKAKFKEVAVATSGEPGLPVLEQTEQFSAGLDRVFRRLIMEDPALELDVSTDTIRVIGQSADAPPRTGRCDRLVPRQGNVSPRRHADWLCLAARLFSFIGVVYHILWITKGR